MPSRMLKTGAPGTTLPPLSHSHHPPESKGAHPGIVVNAMGLVPSWANRASEWVCYPSRSTPAGVSLRKGEMR